MGKKKQQRSEAMTAVIAILYIIYWTIVAIGAALIIAGIAAYIWFTGAPWHRVPRNAPGIYGAGACGYVQRWPFNRPCILGMFHPGWHRAARIVTRPVRATGQTLVFVLAWCAVVWPVRTAIGATAFVIAFSGYVAGYRFRLYRLSKPRRVKAVVTAPKPVTAKPDSLRASEYFDTLRHTATDRKVTP